MPDLCLVIFFSKSRVGRGKRDGYDESRDYFAPHKGFWVMSGDILGCHNEGGAKGT